MMMHSVRPAEAAQSKNFFKGIHHLPMQLTNPRNLPWILRIWKARDSQTIPLKDQALAKSSDDYGDSDFGHAYVIGHVDIAQRY